MKELELLVNEAEKITRQYFGKTIGLYAPLYISNYCENECLYCGFNAAHKINRKKLSATEIELECQTLQKTGIQNILILTGESRKNSPVEYIKEAVLIAKKYFPYIALEVYPLETAEYQELALAGVDGVTLYQETYDREIYQKIHLSGKKIDYDYRRQTPERIAQAGIRNINLGVLLGLADWQQDTAALFEHLEYLLKKYPGVEYGLSFPRMQGWPGCNFKYQAVSDPDLVKIIAQARVRFPRIDINLSTRESAQFRDNILNLGITRMSAGSLTTVGGYAKPDDSGEQFEVNDDRSLQYFLDSLFGFDLFLKIISFKFFICCYNSIINPELFN